MVIDEHGAESSTGATNLQHRLRAIWHRLTVRFVLLLGVIIFLTAVGIDSFHHQASAADMGFTGVPVSTMPALKVTQNGLSAEPSATTADTYLEFDSETAERLGHSHLTSASLTRSRLTSAHLFPQKAR